MSSGIMGTIFLALVLIASPSETERIRTLLDQIHKYKTTDNLAELKKAASELAAFSDRLPSKGLFSTASSLTEKGLWGEGLLFWKALQEQDPQFLPLQTGYLAALCYGGQGEFQKAIGTLRSLEERGLQDADTLLLLADLYQENGNLPSAVQYLEKTIAIDPKHLEAFLALGKLLQRGGEFQRANQLYQKAIHQGIEHPQLLYQKALALISLGDAERLSATVRSQHLEDAYRLLQRLQSSVPPNAEVHNQTGIALTKLGRKEEAGQEFERAVALDPSHPDYTFHLSFHYSQTEKYEEAIKLLEKMTAAHPPSVEVHDRLLWLYWKTNRQNEGRKILPILVGLDPSRLRSHLLATRFYHDFGDLEKAVQHSEKAVGLGPDNFMAHHLRGLVLTVQEQFDSARLAFQKAVELNPQDVDSLVQLGKISMREGKDDQAEKYFLTALQKNPHQVGVHFQLGTLYRKRGDLEKARRELELFEKLNRETKRK